MNGLLLSCRVFSVVGVLAALLGCGLAGCKKPQTSAPPSAPATAPAPGFAAALVSAAATDPELKAAQAAASDLFGGLLARRYDNDKDLAPVARKVNGWSTWSVISQEKNDNGAGASPSWTFIGVLASPGKTANFSASVARQRDGTWAIGWFDGPNAR